MKTSCAEGDAEGHRRGGHDRHARIPRQHPQPELEIEPGEGKRAARSGGGEVERARAGCPPQRARHIDRFDAGEDRG
jgi:hypothetical protein